MKLSGALLVLAPLALVSARREPFIHEDAQTVLKTTRIIGGQEAEYGRYPYAGETQRKK